MKGLDKMIKVNLLMEDGRYLSYNEKILSPYIDELLSFLEDEEYMHSYSFAKKMMMGPEIKSNNTIEGINDDLSYIDRVIKSFNNPDNNTKKRILNLYMGYKYILTHDRIDKDSLRELYGILSKGLLSYDDIKYMGEYYRTRGVIILKGNHLRNDNFTGMEAIKLDKYMDLFFEYVNSPSSKDEMDVFIKSQIMHFYFVYVHPYFDVNGRTSRTVAMWYMLNNQVYPYIIFNQAIAFARGEYEKSIINARAMGDVTLFLRYMLTQVLWELEKEYIVNKINKANMNQLSKEDLQLINYLLTIKGNITVKDLTSFYNRFNFPKRPGELFDKMISPLIDKGVILDKGFTKGYMDQERHNMNIGLNLESIDDCSDKVRHLVLHRN